MKILGSNLELPDDDPDYLKTLEIHGKKYHVQPRIGTDLDLSRLKHNESVCYGDGKTYHYLLTKKEN